MNRVFFVTFFSTFVVFSLVVLSNCSKDASSTAGKTSEAALPQTAAARQNENQAIDYALIEWTDLLPDEDLEALENPPDYLSEIEDGSEADQIGSQLNAGTTDSGKNAEKDRYQQALSSRKVRPEFDGRPVRVPGFIVPLEFDDHQTITTFFFVPFFGACIHAPPPPPNQIIYAEYEPGIRLDALYDPFWINGTLSTTIVENDLATSAYSISVSAIEPYYPELDPLADDIE